METRTEQKARTRRKLIECALDLSAQKGFAALSLREVTQAAELTPAAFYRHFRDMEELGLSLVDEIALSLRRLLRNARKNSATADASTMTVFSIETFLKYVNENSHLFRLLLGERSGSSDSFRQAIRHEIEIFVVELTEDLERIAAARKEKLRNSAYAAEAIVNVVFTVGAEVLDLPKNKQNNLKTRLVEEVNMILRGAKVYVKNKNESFQRMPTVFVGHGSPMNAVQKNSFTDFLSVFPKDLPKPKAVLVVSAHWETRGTKVLKVEVPKTIHDFGGFPQALYEIQYPAHGDLALADRITKLSSLHHIEADGSWGLDHGTWSVLKHMYPLADIPVLQLSLNQNMTFSDHLAVAEQLRPLRDEGVLILGSGNVTHNLRRVVWDENAKPVDWAAEFDGLVKAALINRDNQFLLGFDLKHKDLWNVAHPSPEHYLPLLYAYGASDSKDNVKFVFEGMQMGSLSMRSMIFT